MKPTKFFKSKKNHFFKKMSSEFNSKAFSILIIIYIAQCNIITGGTNKFTVVYS